jgi:hypothetical protein
VVLQRLSVSRSALLALLVDDHFAIRPESLRLARRERKITSACSSAVDPSHRRVRKVREERDCTALWFELEAARG